MDNGELQLLRDATSARFYSDENFLCQGLTSSAARHKTSQALGRNFDTRLAIVTRLLKARFGEERVEEATAIVAIGHKLTPAYCRKTSGTIAGARRALARLEEQLGVQ